MPFFIGADCLDVNDLSCVEECPVDCIYQGERKEYINPHECIDCGACEPVCPVSAISTDLNKLTDDQVAWREDNAAFFDAVLPGREQALGSPGGAMALGPLGVDTPMASEAQQ
ncbi:ferredoxin [uncultured Jatrophihabitans sp.]|uniref:ferredoxin n=1 Tax=uncultured Jatrophihabitans sp. TaxID=1610747 RepID=UPI0035CC5CF8